MLHQLVLRCSRYLAIFALGEGFHVFFEVVLAILLAVIGLWFGSYLLRLVALINFLHVYLKLIFPVLLVFRSWCVVDKWLIFILRFEHELLRVVGIQVLVFFKGYSLFSLISFFNHHGGASFGTTNFEPFLFLRPCITVLILIWEWILPLCSLSRIVLLSLWRRIFHNCLEFLIWTHWLLKEFIHFRVNLVLGSFLLHILRRFTSTPVLQVFKFIKFFNVSIASYFILLCILHYLRLAFLILDIRWSKIIWFTCIAKHLAIFNMWKHMTAGVLDILVVIVWMLVVVHCVSHWWLLEGFLLIWRLLFLH